MFRFINESSGFKKGILILAGIALLLTGGYAGLNAGQQRDYLVKVDGISLTAADYGRMLQRLGLPGDLPPAQQAEALRLLSLQQVLFNEARARRITADPAEVRVLINQDPLFHDREGHFDYGRYKSLLAAQQTNPARHEERVSDDIAQQRLLGSLDLSNIVSRAVLDDQSRRLGAPRQIAWARFSTDGFRERIQPSAADLRKYYDEHLIEFQQPERVKLDYLIFSQDAIDTSSIDEKQIKAYYEANKATFDQETRRVRHILITSQGDAATRKAARDKAETLRTQLLQNPAHFAEIAHKESQDPGSARQGGDLGEVRRGAMVKPFEDAAFALKPNEISPVVETEFGYHILRVEAIQHQGLAEARLQIIETLRAQRYSTDAEAFGKLVFDESDSLEPAARKWHLTIQQSNWIDRDGAQQGGKPDPLLDAPALRAKLFIADVLERRHNTEVVEIKPGTRVAARVLEHEPARQKKLEEVSHQIADTLKQQGGLQQAQALGTRWLDALKGGKSSLPGEGALDWSTTQTLTRVSRVTQPQLQGHLTTLFNLPLPENTYWGSADQDGYTLFRIHAAGHEKSTSSPAQKPNLQQQAKDQELLHQILAQQGANAQRAAYLNGVQSKHVVEINPAIRRSTPSPG